MNISNMLEYKKRGYRIKKYLYKKCSHTKEIDTKWFYYFLRKAFRWDFWN